jgi:hypothetical protein
MGRLDIEDRPRDWSWNWGDDDEGHQPQESLVWDADREEGYEPLIMRGFD